jgi:hypothetical protein
MPVVSYDSEDGLTVGGASTSKLGFFGTTPATRAAVTYNATITASWIQGTNGFGFDSTSAITSVIGAIKDIQHVLTRLGLWE